MDQVRKLEEREKEKARVKKLVDKNTITTRLPFGGVETGESPCNIFTHPRRIVSSHCRPVQVRRFGSQVDSRIRVDTIQSTEADPKSQLGSPVDEKDLQADPIATIISTRLGVRSSSGRPHLAQHKVSAQNHESTRARHQNRFGRILNETRESYW